MCTRNVQVILIGNKTDLDTKRVVSTEQGKQYATDNEIDYFETSALTGEGVKEVFDFVVKSLISNAEYEEEENNKAKGINLKESKNNSDNNRCGC